MSLAAPPILAPPQRRSPAFLLAYALANAGGVIAYLPLLTLLLPIKVEAIAGPNRFGLLTATVVVGAIAASAANILFGWLSDRAVARGGGRRGSMATGLAATAGSFVLVTLASSAATVIGAVALFQVAVNAVLAPLLAIMADEIPDEQKGMAGGLLAVASPVASALSALLVGLVYVGEGARFAIVAAAMIGCALPLLLTPSRRLPPAPRPIIGHITLPRNLALASAARLMVQVAGNVLSLYLLYYFESIGPRAADAGLPAHVGHLLTIAYALPLPVALVFGRLSDRLARRKPFLLTAAVIAATGLVGMAVAHHWAASATGFGLYAVGSAVFLALHSGFAAQLLPDPAHRGRDLGLLNLTNTLPALVGPVLAWWLATPRDFSAVMLVLAGVTLAGGLIVLAVGDRR